MTDKNIRTEESLDISENSNLLDNENNNEIDNIINNSLSEEEVEESDTITNQKIDSDSDIPEKDEENSDIPEEDELKDEDTTTTDDANTDESNEEEDEYNSFNHPNNKIYSDNINALMFTKKIKEDAWERFINHKINFVKDNNISKVLSVIIISIVMFFIGRYMDKYIMVDNPGDTTLKITRFIVKYSYLLILYFGGILELIVDLFVIFLIELADLLMFLSNVSSYNVLLKNAWLLKQFLDIKDKEENDSDNNNNSKSIIIIAINGIFYLLIMGVLIPLDALTKGLNNLIIQIANGTCNLLLPTKMVNKKAPDMDINRFLNKNKQVKGVIEKDKEKEQKPKRGFFNRLRDRIKNYLNGIVTSNDRLVSTLKDNINSNGNKNKTKTKTLGIVKEAKDKSKGKNTSKGKNATKGKNKSKSGVKEEEELGGSSKETDTKGKDDISKREGKSDDNESKRVEQEVTATKSGQKRDDNSSKSDLHDSTTIDNQSKKETVTQQGNSIKSDNINQGVGTNNTTKTGDTVKEPPKSTKQLQNNFDPEKERQRQIDRKELHDLFTKGKVSDDNDNGVGGKFTKEEAQKIAEKVKERNERQQLNKEEDKSKNPDDNKKQGQSEQVDTVISDSIDTVDGGKNKGDVAKDKIDQKFKKADKRTEVFNKQPQKIEQINESLKKLEEIRKKSRQRENTKGLEGVQELKNPGETKTKDNWRKRVQNQDNDSKSQVKGSGR